jgi:hypothetical protein
MEDFEYLWCFFFLAIILWVVVMGHPYVCLKYPPYGENFQSQSQKGSLKLKSKKNQLKQNGHKKKKIVSPPPNHNHQHQLRTNHMDHQPQQQQQQHQQEAFYIPPNRITYYPNPNTNNVHGDHNNNPQPGASFYQANPPQDYQPTNIPSHVNTHVSENMYNQQPMMNPPRPSSSPPGFPSQTIHQNHNHQGMSQPYPPSPVLSDNHGYQSQMRENMHHQAMDQPMPPSPLHSQGNQMAHMKNSHVGNMEVLSQPPLVPQGMVEPHQESMSGDSFFSGGGLSPANGSEWGSPV